MHAAGQRRRGGRILHARQRIRGQIDGKAARGPQVAAATQAAERQPTARARRAGVVIQAAHADPLETGGPQRLVLREHRRNQSEFRCIRLGDRVLHVIHHRHLRQRPEGFAVRGALEARHLHQAWAHEPSLAIEARRLQQHATARTRERCLSLDHGVSRRARHDRPHEQRLGVGARTHHQRTGHLGEGRDESFGDVGVHDDATRAGAALARGGVGAAHTLDHGATQVRVLPHDRRVAATHLQGNHAARPIEVRLQDAPPHGK